MKTFEEKYVAWIDGVLPAEEIPAFESELLSQGGSLDERTEFGKLGDLLSTHLPVPALKSPDFFNHQIIERIHGEKAEPRRSVGWFGLPRLAWLGGLSFSLSLALFLAIIPKKAETHSREAFIAQVISARSADPSVTATAFQASDSEGDQMAVVWLDGLDYVPQESPHVR